ncbi:NAD(P)/FAD-dependent oxidoreductase [Pseudonocardia sp. MH-G8]|uniref:flavin-containing monooxygenase n=1 Tax=Pseudonocardia sp. MH-G8 TaxID=1854588 RepID=UPI000BA0E0A7|nr:NAD(P)/FAD-dependent oxidoreductase [Pseudonocardia sp. MH-G8]OZM79288.1 monooxygenase [Pseudonocardia sp. MH-G8]
MPAPETVATDRTGSPDNVPAFLAALAQLDDDALRGAVEDAEIPALLAALAHLTGDMSLVAEDLRAPMHSLQAQVAPQGGMSPEALTAARAAAVDALRRVRDGALRVDTASAPERMAALMRFLTGNAGDEYLPLLEHELGLTRDVGAPGWTLDEVAPGREFSVVVIGAGMSGLVAAHRLEQAGVPFTVLEKNDDVGGTWLENDYPGCRLDTNNFAYSYSFAQKPDWPYQFSAQADIRSYFSDVATRAGLRRHIRFGTTVLALAYDEDAAVWRVRIRGADSAEETLVANAVVSAVGQLNQPNYPDIPGRDRFEGLAMHSARWVPGTDLTGLRVGVVGTGASAYQIVPSIADEVGELRVFQRNAPWMLPTPGYHRAIPSGLSWLFQHVPGYHQWFRFWQFWVAAEGRLHLVGVDPEWTEPDSVSAPNAMLRRQLLAHLATQYPDRPDLLEKVTPTYVAGAKRMLRDNGVWAAALHQPHVHLVTDGISEITPKGVRTVDGVEHELDVIVYATGFLASEFLSPMTVTGRGGVDLHAQWDGDARAYLGITVPEFPNLFSLYGPNTNLVVTGSIIYMAECAIEYTMQCLRTVLTGGHRAIDTRSTAYDAFAESVDRENRSKAWGASGVSSWYKNDRGRVTQNWPFPLLTYWQLTREPDPAAVELL